MNFREYYLHEALGDYFPTVKKATRALSPSSLAAFAQGMSPEYTDQFAKRPKIDTGSIFQGKTLAEIQGKVLKWRTKHITNKDGTPDEEKATRDLKAAVDAGLAPSIKMFPDGTIEDSNYTPPGSSTPKKFTSLGHYANTVLDSMLLYAQKGYPLQETRRFLRYDKKALEILEKNGYLYTG